MLKFIKEFSKSCLCFFASGFVFEFILLIFILCRNPASKIQGAPSTIHSIIILSLVFPMCIFLFLPYYTWLKYRLTEDFYQLKWYYHTISGFFIISLFFITIITSSILKPAFIKSIEKSEYSSLWYFLGICFFPFLFAEINYQLKKHNKLRLNKQLDIEPKNVCNSTFRDGFS